MGHSRGQSAIYQETLIAEYNDNPLIEALPPILSELRAAEAIASYPKMNERERELPAEIRLHCIGRLGTLIQPLPIHLELESAVSILLRRGYVGRNPMLSSTWRHLHTLSNEQLKMSGFTSSAGTFSLVGLSGIGKSTALDSILRLYPQVIVHRCHKQKEFIQKQIVWLKLECPFDGSLSGLCHAFFRAVDQALGIEKYVLRFTKKASVLLMIQRMAKLSGTYFIGGLFIDELQHLNSAKAGGKDNMLNFFVNLINEIGIPVVFIGTNSMINLFADVMRNARRGCGLGTIDFKQPKENDVSWNMLVEAVWDYQWVKKPVELTDQLSAVLYDLTQGVTDFLAKMMILGQRYAIQSGLETLNENVFQHVADTKMKLLKPAIAALRSGDPQKMCLFEDLLPTDAQIAAMMDEDELPDSAQRIALLRQLKGATGTKINVENISEELKPSAVAKTEVAAPTVFEKSVATSNAIIAKSSIALIISEDSDPLSKLREANWLVFDAFEFSDVYSGKARIPKAS